jgi:hypothetical protein
MNVSVRVCVRVHVYVHVYVFRATVSIGVYVYTWDIHICAYIRMYVQRCRNAHVYVDVHMNV